MCRWQRLTCCDRHIIRELVERKTGGTVPKQWYIDSTTPILYIPTTYIVYPYPLYSTPPGRVSLVNTIVCTLGVSSCRVIGRRLFCLVIGCANRRVAPLLHIC